MGKAIVSGASGWLGRSAINSLKNQVGLANIFAFTSIEKQVVIDDREKVNSKIFINNDLTEKVEGFIHLAFLTKDKLSSNTPEDYIDQNRKIINQACETIKRCEPRWIATVSSGAVYRPNSVEYEDSIKENPYGYLKLEEEERLRAAAKSIGANLAIGRLWGASGFLMPVNRSYALSDFIVQGVTNGKIEIKSEHRVLRRYVDAQSFMNVLIAAAKSKKEITFDSGGPLVEIGELAKLVADELKIGAIMRPPSAGGRADEYYPRGNGYEILAAEFNIDVDDIKNQVANTIKGHLPLL